MRWMPWQPPVFSERALDRLGSDPDTKLLIAESILEYLISPLFHPPLLIAQPLATKSVRITVSQLGTLSDFVELLTMSVSGLKAILIDKRPQ